MYLICINLYTVLYHHFLYLKIVRPLHENDTVFFLLLLYMYLLPRVRFDLWKLELRIIRIHLADLFARGRPEHLDDLDQLVHARIARKDRLAEQQLREDAARAPHVDLGGVIDGAEDQLRGAIVPAADVRHVRFALHQVFGAAEVAQL